MLCIFVPRVNVDGTPVIFGHFAGSDQRFVGIGGAGCSFAQMRRTSTFLRFAGFSSGCGGVIALRPGR